MADPTNIVLSCLIFGDDISKSFSLKISPSSSITKLVHDIVSTYRIYEDEELTGVKLVQCALAEDQLSDVPPLSNESVLDRRRFVKDYWPDSSAIDQRLIQVLVHAASRSRVVPATRPTPSVVGLTDTFRQLTTAQERTRRKILDGPSASVAALPRVFMAQQKRDDTPIYNGRPSDRTGNPIELYHQAFRIFLDHLNQEDVPRPSEMDYISMENLLRDSQATYNHEDKRGIALTTHLSMILRRDISRTRVLGCQADGVIKWRSPSNGLQAYYSILDIKNEIGDATCDPSIQGAQSYATYWSQDEASEPDSETIVLPILHNCHSWALDMHSRWHESRLRYLTRVLVTLRDAIDHLDAYYQPLVNGASLPFPLRDDLARFYPDIRQYQANCHETKIIYLGNLTGLVFKAQTEDGRHIAVKFVERYNALAHELLALYDLAPKLLFDSADRLYGRYRMVVMELIDGRPLSEVNVGSQAARDVFQRTRPSVELALKLLLGANFAFGDLQPPNIMVVEENGETKAKLIDFDWCVVAGEGRYPVNLSEQIMWPEGVERGGLIQKGHDIAMLDSMFP